MNRLLKYVAMGNDSASYRILTKMAKSQYNKHGPGLLCLTNTGVLLRFISLFRQEIEEASNPSCLPLAYVHDAKYISHAGEAVTHPCLLLTYAYDAIYISFTAYPNLTVNGFQITCKGIFSSSIL